MTPDLLDVGRVDRAHGLGGDVVVELWTNVTSRLDPGSVLATDGGDLRVVSSRPFKERFLVHFDGIVGREAADGLRGTVLRAPPVADRGELWVHQLVGSVVVDGRGEVLGTVEAVEPNPASDLLVLDGGGLIPLRFVVAHEPGTRVVVDVPEGLLE
jgi:16S rRNA processing protein RimM